MNHILLILFFALFISFDLIFESSQLTIAIRNHVQCLSWSSIWGLSNLHEIVCVFSVIHQRTVDRCQLYQIGIPATTTTTTTITATSKNTISVVSLHDCNSLPLFSLIECITMSGSNLKIHVRPLLLYIHNSVLNNTITQWTFFFFGRWQCDWLVIDQFELYNIHSIDCTFR